MRVDYYSTGRSYSEWICFEHTGYAREKASKWWVARGGQSPTPRTVSDAMGRGGELTMPTHVKVRREGKYWAIVAYA
jgi:DNA repair protein RadD